MLRLTDDVLHWLLKRIPDPPVKPKGGRPPLDKAKAARGIFWILDNGAKWKDLPREFGAKSAVHRYFQRWVRDGIFERILRQAGRVAEERDGFKLYECFIDGTFAKARGGGDGVGLTKAGKGVKIMILVDAQGLPVAIDTMAASPHESKLVQRLFDFMLTSAVPEPRRRRQGV
ncbi:MAG: transposase [Phycisphaerae bacterium]